MMQKRTSKEIIEELLSPLEGANVIDVGCGDGQLTRMLTRRGAHVTGIEVSPRALALARAATPVGDERYMQGLAEDLPVKSRSADILVFLNSFHHVDEQGQPGALKEAARVLKDGGLLFISEPLPEGPYFQLMRVAHDETKVRNRAQEVLSHAAEAKLLLEKTLSHIDTVKLKDFEAFHDRITAINPETRAAFIEHEPMIREDFERLGRKVDDHWEFDQPTRVHLFRRS
jgi:hypothetical protein